MSVLIDYVVIFSHFDGKNYTTEVAKVFFKKSVSGNLVAAFSFASFESMVISFFIEFVWQ